MIRVVQFLGVAVAIVSVSSLVGCGGSEGVGEEQQTVSGSVTFNGTPIAKGDIVFEDPTGKALGASATIEDGKYSAKCAVGTYKVKIYAQEEIGEKDATGVAPTREMIPAKYNEATELEAAIKEGENKKDFKLQS